MSYAAQQPSISTRVARKFDAGSTNGRRPFALNAPRETLAAPPVEPSSDVQTQSGAELSEIRTVRFTLYERKEPPLHLVAGVPFEILKEGGLIVLRHPPWSLNGRGFTLGEAEMSLIRQARFIADLYVDEPLDMMTLPAIEMRDFIISVL